jgi:hypothetical protein
VPFLFLLPVAFGLMELTWFVCLDVETSWHDELKQEEYDEAQTSAT